MTFTPWIGRNPDRSISPGSLLGSSTPKDRRYQLRSRRVTQPPRKDTENRVAHIAAYRLDPPQSSWRRYQGHAGIATPCFKPCDHGHVYAAITSAKRQAQSSVVGLFAGKES